MQVIQNQYTCGQNAKIDKVTKEQDVKHYNWSPSYLKIFYSKHLVSLHMGLFAGLSMRHVLYRAHRASPPKLPHDFGIYIICPSLMSYIK